MMGLGDLHLQGSASPLTAYGYSIRHSLSDYPSFTCMNFLHSVVQQGAANVKNRIVEENQIHGGVLIVVGHQSCLLHVGHGAVVVSPLAREAQQDLKWKQLQAAV